MLFIVGGMRTAEGREHPIRCTLSSSQINPFLSVGCERPQFFFLPNLSIHGNLFSRSIFLPLPLSTLQTHRRRLGVFVLIDKSVTTTLIAAITISNLPWLFQELKKNRPVFLPSRILEHSFLFTIYFRHSRLSKWVTLSFRSQEAKQQSISFGGILLCQQNTQRKDYRTSLIFVLRMAKKLTN